MMNNYNYLIIGNSAGAIGCIEGLRSVDKSGSVAVVAEEKRHVYSRALIPYYLDGKIGGEKMNYRSPDFYHRAGVDLYAGRKAVNIDFSRRVVELEDGERLGYEKLLLATGGKPVVPPITGLDKQNVCTFINLDDALKIERALPGARNAVVLGGGVIGLMAAEVLRKKGLHVFVLELAERVLGPVIDDKAAALVQETFKEPEVEIFTQTTVQEIHGQDEVEKVTLTDGTVLPCDLLVVGVGVSPRVELVEDTEIKIDRGIVVNKKMQTSIPDVYACGDCASIYDFIMGEIRPLPLWPNAYAGGRVAAFNMAGFDREYDWGTSMNAMHFFDLNIINAGLNLSGKDEEDWDVTWHLDEDRRVYRKFILDKEGRLTGFILAGEVARAGILLNLMRKKVDVRAFKDQLLQSGFGYKNIPDELRWQLLKDEVIMGVV